MVTASQNASQISRLQRPINFALHFRRQNRRLAASPLLRRRRILRKHIAGRVGGFAPQIRSTRGGPVLHTVIHSRPPRLLTSAGVRSFFSMSNEIS